MLNEAPYKGDISQTTLDTIRLWVTDGIWGGSFMTAVLENNLREAFGCADLQNRATMFQIVSYCWNEIPAACWGSPEKCALWAKMHAERREREYKQNEAKADTGDAGCV